MSIFGIFGMALMYLILQSGGEWYLGVGPDEAPAAANACLIAAIIYVIYLVYCGLKLGKASVHKEKVPDDD